jgi:uracil-DNA glycosylase family 4
VTLAQRIVACERCPRLREHCRHVALVKRRAYRDQEYWGRPVPPFGAADPRLLVVGLAPGAHGANRTGRIFTGDSSGDWLYRALHLAGFANRPESTHAGDGLALADAAVTCVVRCAPPGNRPAREEILACRPWLVEEIRGYRRLRAVVALGRIAYDGVLGAFEEAGREPFAPRTAFRHGARLSSGEVTLLLSYHPSRQNTQTGRLTRAMLDGVFADARRILAG